MNKLQNLTFLLLATFLIVSCGDARFDRIPGKYQDLLPVEFMGTYEFKGKDYKTPQTDSLQIVVSSTEIKFKTPTTQTVWNIHQQFQFTSLSKYYVLGMPDKTIKSLWNIAIIENTAAGLKVYPFIENRLSNDQETRLMKYLPIRDLLLQHDALVAAPNSSDGGAIPLGDGTGMPDMVRYYSVSDEQILMYFENELQGKEYIFLKKVVANKDAKKGKK